MTEKTIENLAFAEELKAIKLAYGPRYYMEDAAVQKAADFWGVHCNPHGVVKGYQTETIAQAGKCWGTVDFAESTKGYWLIGVHAQTPLSGMGYAPSVFAAYGYTSYHDARLAGIAQLTDYFNGTSNGAGPSMSADIKDILEQLRAEETPQLTLF